MIIGAAITIGSRILDAIDAIELGLPYDVWFIIGLAIFWVKPYTSSFFSSE